MIAAFITLSASILIMVTKQVMIDNYSLYNTPVRKTRKKRGKRRGYQK